MVEITIDESKKMMLSMLEEIDSFCRDNNIPYYLTGGTLLGAVRHNGFIPWDDDIDIALKRKDYERLLQEFKSRSGDVEILDYKNKKNFIWPAAKIVNNKTVLIESGIKKAAIGLYLDMFPLDNVPGDYEEAKAFVGKVARWKNALTLKYMQVSRKRKLIKNIVVVLAKTLYVIPDKVFLGRIESISRKYENDSDCNYLCNLSGAWGVKEIVDKKDFEGIENHLFERKNFWIPSGYDDLLRSLYGDYMQLPPVEKRVSTHTSKIYRK